ncbi:MAG TPA: hypothetical protein VMH34_10620 [Gammaproteobacteria bacterium]|nr:hypothetical protein [Gammaproteobacteria bacterium]
MANVKTITKTLWSETIIEMLIDGLKRNAGDKEIRELIREIRNKGFKRRYVLAKVEKSVGTPAMERVRQLSSGSKSPEQPKQ